MLGFGTRSLSLQDLALSDNPNYKGFNTSGRESAVSNAAHSLLGPSMGAVDSTLILPTVAAPLMAVSAQAADTGQLLVVYINYYERSAIVALSGTTPVQVVASALRVNQAVYLPGSNAGQITLSIGSANLSKIRAGEGYAHVALYTAPRGQKSWLLNVVVNVEASKVAHVHLHSKGRGRPGSYILAETFVSNAFSPTDILFPFLLDDPLGDYGLDVWIEAQMITTGTGIVSAVMQIVSQRTTDPNAPGYGPT